MTIRFGPFTFDLDTRQLTTPTARKHDRSRAVPGNPLTTIAVLRDVRFVMKRGTVVKDELSSRKRPCRSGAKALVRRVVNVNARVS